MKIVMMQSSQMYGVKQSHITYNDILHWRQHEKTYKDACMYRESSKIEHLGDQA